MADTPRPGSPISLRLAAIWLLAALATIAALVGLAHWQLGRALDARSQTLLAAASNGDALASWSLTDAEDIIAGRVFGRAGFRFDDAGLHITSQGEAVEFGLRLAGPLDLRRHGALRLAVLGDPRFRYQWSAHFAGTAEPCRSEPLAAIGDRLDRRLDQLSWNCVSTDSVTSLRLVVDGPDGASVTFRDIGFFPTGALVIPAASHIPTITSVNELAAVIPVLNAQPATTQPIAIMPLGPIDAAGLYRRALASNAVPGLLTFTSASAVTAPTASSPLSVLTTSLPFALLLILGRWPPRSPRSRAAAELVAALAMPLWLTVGLRLGTPMNVLDQLFCGVGAVYLWRRVAEPALAWSWLGNAAAWRLPIISIAVALLLVWPFRDSTTASPVDTFAVLRYFAWAGLQQLIVSRCVADRLTTLGWTVPWISLGTAAAFALLHAPNQSLMLLTLIGGLLWSWNWQRHRALLPNVAAHALCGVMMTSLISRDWLWSAEVGARFFAG